MKWLITFTVALVVTSCGQNYHITQNESSSGATPVPTNPEQPSLCTDQATASATIVLGSGTAADPYIICNVQQLQTVKDGLSAHYELGQNIDASETSAWTEGASGTGFIPIGGCGSNYADCSIGREFFSGSFNGNGFTISNLTINRTRGAVGLFGATAACSVVTNLRMTGANITGSEDTGGVVARLSSELSKVYFGGTLSGGGSSGGLAGVSNGGGHIVASATNATVNCSGDRCGGGVGDNTGDATLVSISGSVTGATATGGFAGRSVSSFPGPIFNAIRSSATVNGVSRVGGLLGDGKTNTFRQSSATGSVTGTGTDVGGVVGYGYYVDLYDSFATGNVVGHGNTGGFIGQQYYYYGYSFRSFATGNVNGNAGSNIGAFVGLTNSDSKNHDSFATGTVTGSGGNVGGFIGNNPGGTTTNSFYNTTASTFHNMGHAVYASWSFLPSLSKVWASVNSALPRFATIEDETISLAGSGTEKDPYVINTPAEFNSLQSYATRISNLKLGSNLDFTATPVLQLGTGDYPHVGNFDGGGKIVSNTDKGLFDSLYSANVNDITFTNSTITGRGALASSCSLCEVDDIITTNLTVNGPAGFQNVSTGALIGSTSCINISNADVTANVNGSASQTGGLVGSLGGTIRDSVAAVTVSAPAQFSVGGFAGSGGTVLNSTITGSVVAGQRLGGVLGSGGGVIENVSVNMTITGVPDSGGVIGRGSGNTTIRNTSVQGAVNGGHSGRSGSFVGNFTGGSLTIENSFALNSLNANNEIGFMVGIFSGAGGTHSITNSYFNGTYTGGGFSHYGAFVGRISNSQTTNLTNLFSTHSRVTEVGSGGGAHVTSTNNYVNLPEATFYSPTHAVYQGTPVWDFTNIWNSPGGAALPTLQ